MTVTVKLFARARDLAGTASIKLELPENATVGQARTVLLERLPGLGVVASSLLSAVDGVYSTAETRLRPDSELACFPPVSGG